MICETMDVGMKLTVAGITLSRCVCCAGMYQVELIDDCLYSWHVKLFK